MVVLGYSHVNEVCCIVCEYGVFQYMEDHECTAAEHVLQFVSMCCKTLTSVFEIVHTKFSNLHGLA